MARPRRSIWTEPTGTVAGILYWLAWAVAIGAVVATLLGFWITSGSVQ